MQASIEEKTGGFQESLKFYKAASDLDPAWELLLLKELSESKQNQRSRIYSYNVSGEEALDTRNYPLAIRRFEEAEKIFRRDKAIEMGFESATRTGYRNYNGHIFRAEAMISS